MAGMSTKFRDMGGQVYVDAEMATAANKALGRQGRCQTHFGAFGSDTAAAQAQISGSSLSRSGTM
jgi:hypothetical protein